MPFVPDDTPATGGRFVPDKAAAPEEKKRKALPKQIDMHPGVGMAEGAMNMGSGMLAKPLSDVAGLAATGKEMMFPTPGGGDPAAFKRNVQDRFTYQPRTSAGRGVAEYNPLALLAKLWGAGSRAAGSAVGGGRDAGPMGSAAGHGVEEALNQLPAFFGMKGAPPVAGALRGGAERLMQSALKPPIEALQTGKAGKAIDTLLNEGVNVSRGGIDKMQGRVDVLNDAIAKAIDKSPATIDKQAVGYRMQGLMDKFQKQVNPSSDLATIQRAWDEFLDTFPDKIPVRQAQEAKQGTTRALGSKAYGELKGADVEAQKTLARGLKEEIARAVPEVRKLNAEESKLLNALPLVERRVLMAANRNPAGLGWLTTDPVKFAGWMADRSEGFKSVVARMLNTGSRTARYTLPPLGMAVTAEADQLPPRPAQAGASPGP